MVCSPTCNRCAKNRHEGEYLDLAPVPNAVLSIHILLHLFDNLFLRRGDGGENAAGELNGRRVIACGRGGQNRASGSQEAGLNQRSYPLEVKGTDFETLFAHTGGIRKDDEPFELGGGFGGHWCC